MRLVGQRRNAGTFRRRLGHRPSRRAESERKRETEFEFFSLHIAGRREGDGRVLSVEWGGSCSRDKVLSLSFYMRVKKIWGKKVGERSGIFYTTLKEGGAVVGEKG